MVVDQKTTDKCEDFPVVLRRGFPNEPIEYYPRTLHAVHFLQLKNMFVAGRAAVANPSRREICRTPEEGFERRAPVGGRLRKTRVNVAFRHPMFLPIVRQHALIRPHARYFEERNPGVLLSISVCLRAFLAS